MKKPVSSDYPLTSQYAAALEKYKAFLAGKAKRNKAARARKSEKVALLIQKKKASNRSIAYTREEWLLSAVEMLRPIFAERGYIMPEKVKATIGFPSSGGTGKVIGQCHSDLASAGGFHETFISPRLEDATRILGVLVHELGHATVGVQHGHKAPFKRFCKALCLEGKPTATTEGEAFKQMVSPILAELGPLPHKALVVMNQKRQKGRNLKVECPCCGFKFRAAKQPLLDGSALDAQGRHVNCPIPGCGEYVGEGVLFQPTKIYLDIDTDGEGGDEEE